MGLLLLNCKADDLLLTQLYGFGNIIKNSVVQNHVCVSIKLSEVYACFSRNSS